MRTHYTTWNRRTHTATLSHLKSTAKNTYTHKYKALCLSFHRNRSLLRLSTKRLTATAVARYVRSQTINGSWMDAFMVLELMGDVFHLRECCMYGVYSFNNYSNLKHNSTNIYIYMVKCICQTRFNLLNISCIP